jgi:hypothetical protein
MCRGEGDPCVGACHGQASVKAAALAAWAPGTRRTAHQHATTVPQAGCGALHAPPEAMSNWEKVVPLRHAHTRARARTNTAGGACSTQGLHLAGLPLATHKPG